MRLPQSVHHIDGGSNVKLSVLQAGHVCLATEVLGSAPCALRRAPVRTVHMLICSSMSSAVNVSISDAPVLHAWHRHSTPAVELTSLHPRLIKAVRSHTGLKQVSQLSSVKYARSRSPFADGRIVQG